MAYNFDTVIERRGTGSIKWQMYGDDVLPMWVADMDFPVPRPVVEALREKIENAIYGYEIPSKDLGEVICARLQRLYNWTVTPDQIVYLPSLVTGLNAVARATGEPGDGILMQTPVYPPFLTAPGNQGRVAQTALLALETNKHTLHYSVDYDTMEAAVTPNTRLLMLCNPHNPTGDAFGPDELLRMAEFCARHDLLICSDEIHCDLLLGDTVHTPMAALAPEIADRTVTLMAPSKTFNMPGLKASFAVITNAALRQRLTKACEGIVPWVNNLGLAAMFAAYQHAECDSWLTALRAYLTGNRDLLVQYISEQIPQLRVTVPQATYLAWLDCRDAGIEGNPFTFFKDQAKVALNDGPTFGPGGEGFVRLNFGCPRATLLEGLERIKQALG